MHAVLPLIQDQQELQAKKETPELNPVRELNQAK
jgi:hypothetical protein